MDVPCIFLGFKVKPGPIERVKLENFTLDNSVGTLKNEAEKKSNIPSASLVLIHHGKILKEDTTLQDSGVKYGEMVHVVKKKEHTVPEPRPAYTDAEIQQLNTALRSLGCTPNAAGWTRAMQNLATFLLSQLLNDESVMNEIIERAPSLALGEDCVALSILHEVELLAALGANVQTMRRGAEAHPELPAALMQLTRMERARATTTTGSTPNESNGPATSGFVYSLEALSEEEDAEEEENDETEQTDRNPITQEQLAAALQAATEAVSSTSTASGSSRQQSFLQLLRGAAGETSRNMQTQPSSAGTNRVLITPEMFSAAISAAINRAGTASTASDTPMEQSTEASTARAVLTPEAVNEALSVAMSRAGSAASTSMEQSTQASSSQSPAPRDEDFTNQLTHMHEMGLLDDAVNVRALLICAGDVNAAINLVFSGAIGDDSI